SLHSAYRYSIILLIDMLVEWRHACQARKLSLHRDELLIGECRNFYGKSAVLNIFRRGFDNNIPTRRGTFVESLTVIEAVGRYGIGIIRIDGVTARCDIGDHCPRQITVRVVTNIGGSQVDEHVLR